MEMEGKNNKYKYPVRSYSDKEIDEFFERDRVEAGRLKALGYIGDLQKK